jgi:hypothetical protein
VTSKHVTTQLPFEPELGTRKYTIERYTYADIIARHGLGKADKQWVYGKELATAKNIESELKKLKQKQRQRLNKLKLKAQAKKGNAQ